MRGACATRCRAWRRCADFPPAVRSLQVTPASLVRPDGIVRIRFLADGTATEALIALRRPDGVAEIRVDWLTGRVSRGG